MTISQFNTLMNAIDRDLHDSGMCHIYTPKIAHTIMRHIKVEEDPTEPKCICQGYYKPPTCPIHGEHPRKKL